jgi:signal transduction histidine kinase
LGRIDSKKSAPSQQSSTKSVEECLERQNITFDAIFRLLEKVGSAQDVKRITQLFLMTLMGQLGLRKASCYLVHPGRKSLRNYYALGLSGKASLPPFHMGSAFVKWLMSSDDPEHIDTFFSCCPEHERNEVEPVGGLVESGFAYGYALKDQEGMVGALFYSGRVTGRAFSEFDNELLKMLSAVATITIKNAWLYQMTLLSKLELEKFAEVKKEFMNHTSHELRTPLTVLRSALWSIEPGEVGENIMVEMAKDAVQSLQNIVEYLLSLNEIELKKTDLRMELTDISGILEDCLREALPELEEKSVQVRLDDRARYRKTMIDPSKMKIVLKSMLGNALDFVAQGGNIHIETAVSEKSPGDEEGIEIGDWYGTLEEQFGGGLFSNLQSGAPGFKSGEEGLSFARTNRQSYFVIRIRDDGIGIPPEEIKTLAEPFRRATNSTVRNVKGLGIGLSVSQKIVAGHGGKIFCRSVPGDGARFSVWLPMSSEEFWDAS